MPDNNKVMLTVLCTVYNHEKYIAKCLESLVNQKCSYKYQIVVHDDASTDNSAQIIKQFENKYPDKIIPIYQKENQWSKGVYIRAEILQKYIEGKYVAVCEGDDFWTDENKIQMQIDYMESHPDCALCAHAAYYADENGKILKNKFFANFNEEKDLSMKEILHGWSFATNSVMYVSKLFPDTSIPFKGKCVNADYALAVFMALQGKIHYFDKLMSAYRINSVNSLTWKWRHNPELYVERRREYIAMLDRIDEYTHQEYHDIIADYKETCIFDLYVFMSDLKKVKEYKSRYKSMPVIKKLKLNVKYYCPWLASSVKKLKSLHQ
ncbi:MAG: glycosyltransferase [Acutalibacteraceae bacterium]|nr:glycosyltransferase [Acutalibacteraceae bacterium]